MSSLFRPDFAVYSNCSSKPWSDHLFLYNLQLNSVRGRSAADRDRRTAIINHCIVHWREKGGSFIDEHGLELVDPRAMVITSLQSNKRRYFKVHLKILQDQSKQRHPKDSQAITKVYCYHDKKPTPRPVAGANVLYIECSDSVIARHVIDTPTTVSELRLQYLEKGIRYAFVVNPNIATTLNKEIVKEDESMVLIILHEGRYNIGVIRKCDTHNCNLEFINILIWQLDVDSFVHKRLWDLPRSWRECKYPVGQVKLESGFVNIVVQGQPSPLDSKTYIRLKAHPDTVQTPKLEEQSLVIYCKINHPCDPCSNPLHGCINSANETLISIPMGFPPSYESKKDSNESPWNPVANQTDDRFHFRNFVELSMTDLRTLCLTLDGSSLENFHAHVESMAKKRGRSCFSRLVPSLDYQTRLVVVTDKEFDTLVRIHPHTGIPYDHIRHTSRGITFEYLVGYERTPPNDTNSPGVCLAAIEISPRIKETTANILNYTAATNVTKILGRDGHKRLCTKHGGHQSFRGCCRATNRPNPTPAVAQEDVPFQAYFDKSRMKNHLGLMGVELVLRQLEECAMESGKRLQPALSSIPDHEQADRRIVTCGLSSFWKGVVLFLGFLNGEHIDVNDLKDEHEFVQWAETSMYKRYMLRVKKMVDCGVITTCQYRHLWNSSHESNLSKCYDVNAFFIHHGLGIAHPLNDCSCVSFLGYAYSHSTSFCYLVGKLDRLVVLQNKKGCNLFNMFAWGTGGNSNRRRARYVAMGGDPNTPRLTQVLMDQFVTQALQDHVSGRNQNAIVGAYAQMDDAQRLAFTQGQSIGPNNQDDPLSATVEI